MLAKVRHEGAHGGADILAFERERDVGGDEAGLVAAIVAGGADGDAMEGLGADQLGHGVGELDLAAGAALRFVEDLHHFRLEDVAADDAERRRRLLWLRLFDEPLHLGESAAALARRDDAVAGGLLRRDLLDADDVAADLPVGVDHLAQAARLAPHEVVGEQHRERLVADDVAGAPHRMAEAERLLLTHRGERAGRKAGRLERLERFAAAPHRRLELIGDVEIVFERGLAPPGDEDHLLDARLARLVHGILDERAIDDRQHLLGESLGGRQESRAETGDGEHRLAYRFHLVSVIGKAGRSGLRQIEPVVAALLRAAKRLVDALRPGDRRRRQQLVGGRRPRGHGRRDRHAVARRRPQGSRPPHAASRRIAAAKASVFMISFRILSESVWKCAQKRILALGASRAPQPPNAILLGRLGGEPPEPHSQTGSQRLLPGPAEKAKRLSAGPGPFIPLLPEWRMILASAFPAPDPGAAGRMRHGARGKGRKRGGGTAPAGAERQGTGRLDRSHAGTPAPDTLFEDPAGEPASIADFRGKPVLVNLWATWCGPCVVEMPSLDALAARNPRIHVLALSQDMNGQEKVDAFFAERKFAKLEPYIDAELSMMSALKVDTLPTTILYDANGREIWRMTGRKIGRAGRRRSF